MHIGSQITEVGPFEQAVRKVLPLVSRLKETHGLEFFSLGGGLGIVYQPALASGAAAWWSSDEARRIITPQKYAARLLPLLKPLGLRILIEPGRFISGNAGILVTRVEYVKRTGKKNFLIVDAAMNDLIRPAFYEDRPLPQAAQGDYLALMSAGAYGFVMASNYNTRCLAAEVMVSGSRSALVRERQPVREIWSGEKTAPWLK